MKPIQVTPAAFHTFDKCWQLFSAEDGALYLLVDCEASFVGYLRMIKLDEYEQRDYHGLGWLSLQHLAYRVNYFVSEYKERAVTGALLEAAIAAWGTSDAAL